MSKRLIVSHYDNNYGGAGKRLDLIEEELAGLDFATAPGCVVNGLKREQLVAMNSSTSCSSPASARSESGSALSEALARDFCNVNRWRAEFMAMGPSSVDRGGSC